MESLLTPAGRARIIPFVLFIVLLAVRGHMPAQGGFIDARWVYGLSVVVVGGSMLVFARNYAELGRGSGMSWKHWALSLVVGLIVFQLWITLSQPWMLMGEPTATFRPVDGNGRLMWGLVATRWIGAAILVPVMEELFWRSFLMRWIDNPEFEKVDPGQVSLKAMVLSTLVFMLAHTQWLAAIVAGLAYAWLYRHTRSLWAPIVAHAVTNGVLGMWVVLTGNWVFW